MERARAAAGTRLLAPVLRSRAAGERRRGPRLSRRQERRLRAARQPLVPFQLVYCGPLATRCVSMPESPTVLPLPTPPAEDVWSVDEHSLEAFAKRLQAPPTDRDWHELRREAERIALVPGFERLITLDANAIKALPHQIDVAQRVLRHMSGRAILADEVGLGKTIEPSIIYKELAIRGLARRVLILTPASRSEERRVGKECRARWVPYQ